MTFDWQWFLLFAAFIAATHSLPTGLSDDGKKNEQTLRPKGTLSTSGLDDVKAALAEGDVFSHSKVPNYSMERQMLSPHERNYEYGEVNEFADTQRSWDLPGYPRYYRFGDDRRKRSDEQTSSGSTSTSTSSPSTKPTPVTYTTPQQQQPIAQAKRSLPYYQEPRYKRELDLDPEDFLTLLSIYDNERRNRGNWRNYGNDEYDNVDDDSNVIGLEDEDPRTGTSWLDVPTYPQHRYLAADPLINAELGIQRSRPTNYYNQYMNDLAQYEQQYNGIQYGTPQYSVPYLQHNYYNPEKRYMVVRKRAQNYDTYGGRNGVLVNSQSRNYPSYQHRLVY